MALRLLTPPADPVVTLAELKAQVVAEDFTDDDVLLQSFEQAAVGLLDGWTGILGRCLNPQTWRLSYDSFPCGALKIPLGPVIGSVVLTYTDVDGNSQTWAPENYVLDTEGVEGWIAPVDEWPETADTINAVQVEYQAGYSEVPSGIKQAIKMIVADWYEYRHSVDAEDLVAVPYGAEQLLTPFKRYAV